MLRIEINGKDVTNDVSISRCNVDLALSRFSDGAMIKFNDSENNWKNWGLNAGDSIAIYRNRDRCMSGKVGGVINAPGICAVNVSSKSNYETHCATFEKCSLSDLLKDIADRFNATIEGLSGDFSTEIEGFVFENETFSNLVERLSSLFGFAYILNGDKISAFTYGWLKSQNVSAEVEAKDITESIEALRNADTGFKATNGKESAGSGSATILYYGLANKSMMQRIVDSSAQKVALEQAKATFELGDLNADVPFLYPGMKIKANGIDCIVVRNVAFFERNVQIITAWRLE